MNHISWSQQVNWLKCANLWDKKAFHVLQSAILDAFHNFSYILRKLFYIKDISAWSDSYQCYQVFLNHQDIKKSCNIFELNLFIILFVCFFFFFFFLYIWFSCCCILHVLSYFVPAKFLNIQEDPHQLWNGQGRMSVIQLNGNLTNKRAALSMIST